MEDEEVIVDDTDVETESTDVSDETSQADAGISTLSIVYEEQTEYDYVGVNYSSFASAVSDFSVDSELYTIKLTSDIGDCVFAVPKDVSEYVQVIDGMVYNFSSHTISLASKCPSQWNTSGTYYYILEIPSYGSEEYYKCLAKDRDTSGNLSYYHFYPFSLYRAYLSNSYDMTIDRSEQLLLNSSVSPNPATFSTETSSFMSWDITTIFVFIIMIFLVIKSLFRKGV